MREGDRELRAEDVQYEANDTAFKADGGIEYTDPQVHVKGTGGGSYSATGGADFNAAEFELRERTARGAADRMQLTPSGRHQARTACASPPARGTMRRGS